jgi:hypothetical protein
MSPTELKMQPTIHLRKDNVDICFLIERNIEHS